LIPYGKQSLDQSDIDSVVDVLNSDFLTTGPKVVEFEKKISNYCDAKYALSFNSATSALHIACLSIGISEGDIVWTSPISFVASSNCALYCGATVDFVDINLETYNICPLMLKEKLIRANKANALPKALIVVHMCGNPSDMESIKTLSDEFGFFIIEDASHAMGAKYKDDFIGSCKYSDLAVFSFHPVKMITTGEGGAITTNCKDIAEKSSLLRTHGITRDKNIQLYNEDSDDWYYEQHELGYNYRLNDIQAALGISQLGKLNDFVDARNKIALNYNQSLPKDIFNLPIIEKNDTSSFHLYVVKVNQELGSSARSELHKFLKEKNIITNVHYIPIYRQPYYRDMGFDKSYFPNSEQYFASCLSLPIFPNLTDEMFQKVIEEINNFFSK
tara:strand:+ start:2727 stop:3890 length:1164 start_codon:yes stop_codon:yes gene_type:complete